MQVPEKTFYRHYKHDPKGPFNNYCYVVVGIARDTEGKSFMVLYLPLYENDWFAPADFQARPLEMFMGTVEKEGKVIPRFTQITDKETIQKLEVIRNQMYQD